MPEWPEPVVMVSKCLEFDRCRYDGSMISCDIVKKLKPFVQFVPVCPELELGLGVPRKPLRLVKTDNEIHLIQPATDKDVTKEMIAFSNAFIAEQSGVHAVILKSRSPSCGIKEVKVYSKKKNAAPINRKTGLFAEQVLNQFNCIVESEGRLRNLFIQQHFLTSMFTLADFDEVKQESLMSELVAFHTKNKFLFMAYNQELLAEMGRVVANQSKKDISEVLKHYQQLLFTLLNIPPSHQTTINVLFHLFGFVSDGLSKGEKEFFLDLIEQYKQGKIPLNNVTTVLRSWIVRFAEPYLSKQTFFSPFPEALLSEESSGIADRQEYWK